MNKLKLGAAIVLLFLAISVDFVSKTMSIASDLVLIGGAICLVLPYFNKKD